MSASDQQSKSSVDIIARASKGQAPVIERMPRPTHRLKLSMRDGIGLDTWIWLPLDQDGPYPAILIRTPYQEHVLGWARLGALRYRDAGYAVVFQLIRGAGTSGGVFTFNNPLDRPDGYDTIEWIAAQPWCTGAVGMDGSSYAGMTQISAACAQPPHLKCIAPAVVSSHPFMHAPFWGGAFSRQHTLGWTQIISVEGLEDLTPGLWGAAALLGAPESWKRLLSRPAIDAADGVLSEDRLQHYRNVLRHPEMDDFYRARTWGPEDYAKIQVPSLVVTGLFDGSMGSQYLWKNLEEHGPPDVERWFLMGPWDHGQAYVGGGPRYGPFEFGEAADFDLPGARLGFFDRHLKGEGPGVGLPARATVYISGANTWALSQAYPDPSVERRPLFLRSDGLANLRGHGRLTWDAPTAAEEPDHFLSDPNLPIMAIAANLDAALVLDLREMERHEDVLSYSLGPLEGAMTLFGEFEIELHLAADTPDCDVVCWLAEASADGALTMLSQGILRLRYRNGFDQEVRLTPGESVRTTVAMNHVSHELPEGSTLRLLIGTSLFPLIDPNPNTGEPIGTGKDTRIARESIFHDAARPSHIRLPIMPAGAAICVDRLG